MSTIFYNYIARQLYFFEIQYNTIQYKNDFYSAVIEGAEALVGRL